MSPATMSGIRCKCGGTLKDDVTEVEFFGIDFGVRKSEVCAECGSEYLPQEVMEELEAEVKRRGLYGLERRGRVAKSGNSLVIRIPKEIVDSLGIKRDLPIVIYPADKKKLVVEVEDKV
ncbi:MAG: AbrB/MazE/SpoVT family DNA-binding domain-containing protein [Nitrososphaerota archaeon]|nr:AbrB/MazE/SpoVT family DNA-binding domain-containing protein [Nitrososphaerota archaeon]MDG6940031.1 AbrB/MazE/SpoVT family DNA-binding domain-containing protein [Nitrososphaerota archaeon]